jgi:hypothetical protein
MELFERIAFSVGVIVMSAGFGVVFILLVLFVIEQSQRLIQISWKDKLFGSMIGPHIFCLSYKSYADDWVESNTKLHEQGIQSRVVEKHTFKEIKNGYGFSYIYFPKRPWRRNE